MTCLECGSTEDIEHHHVIPKSRGGTATVLLCWRCHDKVHGRQRTDSTSALTKEALARRMEAGKTTGVPPLGQQVGPDGETLIPHPDEQAALDLMHRLRADGLSIRKIARALNESDHEPRGKRWYATTVARALKEDT